MILGFTEFEAGFISDAIDGFAREIDVGVYARADSRAAEREFAEISFDFPETVDGMFDLAGVTTELLTETYGCCILQMRTADFKDVAERLSLGEQGRVRFIQCGD